ncbi:hypothetical protein Leryth_004182 [Lithospermum erythrorhizon]|nr:hypothetical protein Leryth_004182 [Lithospermum erythrorhizon]
MKHENDVLIHNPLKPSKCPHIKVIHIFTSLMKGFLAICLVASLSLVSFSTFSNKTRWLKYCADCDNRFIHSWRNFNIQQDHPEKTNLSHVLFGIGGSTETWNERRQYSDIWWQPNVSRGYVWLEQAPIEPWPETSPPFKLSEDTSRFQYTCWYGSRSAIRIARIVKESFELGLTNVRWFVLGDDDTIFFPDNLLTVLQKYDHNEMYYIGGVSESVEQDVVHTYTMAYGGGGFAISYPLAEQLVRILDACIDRYASVYGSDQKIGGCMSEIGIPLTKELGFHQMDVRGNPYGILAAHPMAPLVSLHHLDSMQPLFPEMSRIESAKKLTEAYKLDPSRALQHTFCYDLAKNWSISIAWGYSIQLYPTILTPQDLQTPLQTFLSWRTWSQEPFTFNTRIMSIEPCERPIIYFFEGGAELGHHRTLTSYKRPNPSSHKQCDRDDYSAALSIRMFNVKASIMDPQVWQKAPRRQCCEIISGEDDGVVQVNMRDCNQWETVTPP